MDLKTKSNQNCERVKLFGGLTTKGLKKKHSSGLVGGAMETVTYRGVSIRLSVDFSKETLQARRDWKEVFQVMKVEDLRPRLLYPAKLLFRVEGQKKYIPDKVKLKEFITKPLFYEILKGLI
ncbi:hypothetical protein HJG60_009679 [Phyllostomus discolor]|uniref:L1 transposable element dsRBD-like domain-containing protein n=1 Tax=Phyllostomus discolor TaxID=89673 RepID=A0A834EQ49_9CHIR|nr:hypothetical protein HJG60_009679 [Phyllostomus discolor]